MALREFDRVLYAQHSCASGANHVAVDPRLRSQIVECWLDVITPPFLGCFSIAGAFAMPSAINRENVYANRRQLLGHAVPGFAVTIALMEQQHARAGFAAAK